MNKTTKGTLAATAAVALLASGAGTLAFWNAAGSVPGGVAHTGQLKLIDTGNCAAEPFTFETGQTYNGVNPNITRLVPGDKLTKICTFKVTAIGENLSATLATDGPTVSPNSAFPLIVTGSYTVGGVAQSVITSADNNKIVEARIEADFPYGAVAANNSQQTNKTIGAYTVTATQSDPTP